MQDQCVLIQPVCMPSVIKRWTGHVCLCGDPCVYEGKMGTAESAQMLTFWDFIQLIVLHQQSWSTFIEAGAFTKMNEWFCLVNSVIFVLSIVMCSAEELCIYFCCSHKVIRQILLLWKYEMNATFLLALFVMTTRWKITFQVLFQASVYYSDKSWE